MFVSRPHTLLIATMLFCSLADGAAQSAIYVDALGGDDGNNGFSEAAAVLTLSLGVERATDLQYTLVRVKQGTYDQSHETGGLGTGYPIEILVDGMTIEAFDSNLPVLGGGVANSSVRALFEVVTDTLDQDLQTIVFRNLSFAGEDSANVNAPGAIYFESSDGHVVQAIVDNCVFGRSEMNDPSGGGWPSIRAVAGYKPSQNLPNPSLDLQVIGCRIQAHEAGGVVIDIGADCVDSITHRGGLIVNVEDSIFELESNQGAEAAIDILLEA